MISKEIIIVHLLGKVYGKCNKPTTTRSKKKPVEMHENYCACACDIKTFFHLLLEDIGVRFTNNNQLL